MTTRMPIEFSIIIPSYDRPDQLRACLEAVAHLDFPRNQFEVIVVDDGGSIPVGPVIEPFDGTFSVSSIRQPNSGPALARNTGAQAARGRFLAFTDDDCRPASGWLSALHAVLSDEPGVMAGGKTVNGLGDNACSATSQLIQEFAYEHYNATPGRSRFFASNNLALAASEFDAIGGFDPRFRTAEDRDFCDRWALSGRKMVYVSGALIHHAHHLTLGSFWTQHVSYGRGARRFFLAHRRRAPDTPTIDAKFHIGIFSKITSVLRGRPKAWAQAFLLVVWQAANATGFVLETLLPTKPALPGREEEA